MSLNPQEIGPIPEETARVAYAAYPKGNVWMRIRDELGIMYQDEAFAHLFSHTGQPAEALWRLALVTVMQFAEGLSDRQAADAVRRRNPAPCIKLSGDSRTRLAAGSQPA
jgi:transposase